MKKPIGVIATALMLSGCGVTWYKSGGTQHQFNYDMAQCKVIATGATPMKQVLVSQPSTTYHSGTVYGSNGNTAIYSGTSYNMGNPYAGLSASIGNLGMVIQRSNYIESCMTSKGYSNEKPSEPKRYYGDPSEGTVTHHGVVSSDVWDNWDEDDATNRHAPSRVDKTKR